MAFLLWSNWARGQSCRRISPGSVTSFYTQTHCDFKVCYHISLQSWKWELPFLEMRNSRFPTGVPIPSLIFRKDIGKQMFKAIMSFLWTEIGFITWNFLKQHFSYFTPQNLDIYLQHINIFIQNPIMKPHNIHDLQPLCLHSLKCLFRFLYMVFPFDGRNADFRTVTTATQSD